MKHARQVIGSSIVALVLAACGNGMPQDKTARTNQTLALWPVTTSSAQARQEVTDGIREYDGERWPEAEQHFDRAVAADSALATAQLWAALAAPTAEEGSAHMERAVQLAPGAGAIERLIIHVYQKDRAGDEQGGRALAVQLVKQTPGNPRSWMLLSQQDSLLGNIAQQRVDLDSAIAVAPAFAPAYAALSSSLVQNEPYEYARGEQMARKAVELEPQEEAAYRVLGSSLRSQGRLAEAAQAYTKEAELNPTQGLGLQQRAHANSFLGHYAEARADYEAAVARETDPGNKFGYITFRPNVYLFEGNGRGGYAELDSLYRFVDDEKVPDPAGDKLYLALSQISVAVHYRLLPEAERAYGRADSLASVVAKELGTETFRRRLQAQMALEAGYLGLAKKDYAGAEKGAAEYMRLVASDQSQTKDRPAHLLRALILLEQGKASDALGEFDQAPVTTSNVYGFNGILDVVYANYYHGVALEQVGRTAEARKYYQKVASYYFNSIDAALVHNDAVAKLKKLGA